MKHYETFQPQMKDDMTSWITRIGVSVTLDIETVSE